MKKQLILLVALLFLALSGWGQTTTTVQLYSSDATLAGGIATSTQQFIGTGAWKNNQAVSKFEGYLPLTALGTFAINDIASLQFSTKKEVGTPTNLDFYWSIYTNGTSHIWYEERLTSEPMYYNSYSAPYNVWSTYNTISGTNQMTFYDGNHGPLGFYNAPTLADLQSGPINWNTWTPSGGVTNINYGVQTVKYIFLSTGSAWNASMLSYLDDIEITLNNGDKLIFDLEGLPSVVWVDDDYISGSCGGHTWGVDAFATIQGGINGVAASGTVNVAAGNYTENVIVNKSVTLLGANANNACGSRVAESVIAPSSGVPFTVAISGVTINGFEVTAPTSTNAISIGGRTSNTNIIFNNVHHVGNERYSGNIHAIVLQVTNIDDITDVNISDNCINNINNINNTGSGSAIGILQSASTRTISNLLIENNTISNVNSKAELSGGKGAYGMIINVGSTGGGSAISPIIRNNDISNLSGKWAHAIGLEGNTPGASVINNIVDNLNSSTTPSDACGVMVEDNYGAATISVNNNSFTNLSYGVINKVSDLVNATCNWWGSNDLSTIGAAVYGNVNNIPYLDNGLDAEPGSIGFQPAASCSDCPATNFAEITSANNKIYICHNGHTILVNLNAVPAHLAHGDCLGECPISLIGPDHHTGSDMYLENYPNPFTETTYLMFTLPEDGNVNLEVYDVSGRSVQTLYNGFVRKNTEYKAEFDGTSQPNGIYIYKMTTEKDVFTGKMMLLK